MLVQIWVSSPSTCGERRHVSVLATGGRQKRRAGPHHCAVLADALHVLLVAFLLLLLLDGGDDAPRRAARPDHVLVRHGQQVALLDGQLGLGNL